MNKASVIPPFVRCLSVMLYSGSRLVKAEISRPRALLLQFLMNFRLSEIFMMNKGLLPGWLFGDFFQVDQQTVGTDHSAIHSKNVWITDFLQIHPASLFLALFNSPVD